MSFEKEVLLDGRKQNDWGLSGNRHPADDRWKKGLFEGKGISGRPDDEHGKGSSEAVYRKPEIFQRRAGKGSDF